MPGPAIPKSEGGSKGPNPSNYRTGFNPRSRVIALACAAAGIGTMFMVYPYPPKSDTGNPFETKSTKSVSDRFSKGGAKDHYTPGVATPTNTHEDVSSGQLNEHKKDTMARDHLKAKDYEHADQATGSGTRGPFSNQQEGDAGRPPTTTGDRQKLMPGDQTKAGA